MNGKTHIIWSLALGVLVAAFAHASAIMTAQLLLIAFVAGLLPDIDHPKSTFGHWFKAVNYGVKHRGFMHSIWAIILLTFIWWKLFSPENLFLIVGVSAYTLHLLLDTITPSGVCWLYPVGRISGPIKSDGILSFVVLILGIVLFAIAILFSFSLQLHIF